MVLAFRRSSSWIGPGLLAFVLAPFAAAQEAAGPMTSAPNQPPIIRISNRPEPEAPPSVPQDQIIKHFSEKEDEYGAAMARYSYKKTVRIQSFDFDGKATGEYTLVTEPGRNPDGTVYQKVVERPESTLPHMHPLTEDLDMIERMPFFALTTSQLSKYDLKYIGKEKVDEVDCYLFQVKPKLPERGKGLFDGVVWVDDKHLEIVKTYGRWVTDLGEMKTQALPFALFETYREYIGDKYWFPTYSRSDATVTVDHQEIPIRVIIKYADFKPAGSSPAPVSPAPAARTPSSPQP
ncbi:MAG: hypothetical protein C5B56_08150 [Proteobacteria bacterium]|nr:MAG: hypothetical protein C5B56_08150 [Pseudomonadota bacterium]